MNDRRVRVLLFFRVHYVIDGLGRGGAERSLAELVPALQEHGIEPVLSLFRTVPADGVGNGLLKAGFDVRVLRGSSLFSQSLSLRDAFKKEQTDLVHTTLVVASIVGRVAAARTRIPVLTSLVNTTYEPAQFEDPSVSKVKLRAVQVVDGWSARHLTEHFHAITNAVKISALGTLRIPPERISVIERGRDPTRLGLPSASRRAEARKNLGIDPSAQLILNVGRQEYQKGQAVLLHAFERVASSHPNALLLVAGRPGSASDELRQIVAELALEDRVKFLGHRSDVPELLAAADVFAFSSLFEGLGGAVLEAMALALPIVASDLPALREVLRDGDTAWLVRPGDVHGFAGSLSSALDDRGRAEVFGTSARADFVKRFTLTRSAKRMAELYEQVITTSSGRSAVVSS